jgi:hypothetical protein
VEFKSHTSWKDKTNQIKKTFTVVRQLQKKKKKVDCSSAFSKTKNIASPSCAAQWLRGNGVLRLLIPVNTGMCGLTAFSPACVPARGWLAASYFPQPDTANHPSLVPRRARAPVRNLFLFILTLLGLIYSIQRKFSIFNASF